MKSFKEFQFLFSVVLIIIIYGAETFNRYVLTPLFPLFAHRRGISITVIGSLLGVNDISGLIFSILLTFLLRPNLTKVFFIFGGLLGGVFFLAFGILEYVDNNFLLTIIIFLNCALNGVSLAMVHGCGIPVVNSIYSKHAATTVSIMQTVSGVSIFLAPVAGGILYNIGGFQFPFLVFGTVEVAIVLILGCIMPKSGDEQIKDTKANECLASDMKKFLSYKLLCLSSPFFCYVSALGFRSAALAIFMKERFGLDETNNFYVFFAISLPYTLVSPIFGFLLDRGYCQNLYMVSIFTHPLITLLYFLIDHVQVFNNIYYLIVVLISGAIHCSCLMLSCFFQLKILSTHCDFKSQLNEIAAVSQIFTWIRFFGKMLGSIVFGGFLMDYIGFTNTSLVLCLVTTLSSIAAFQCASNGV